MSDIILKETRNFRKKLNHKEVLTSVSKNQNSQSVFFLIGGMT